MNMIRYNYPWNLLNQLQRDVNTPFTTKDRVDESEYDWAPAVDIHEDEKCYTLLVDVPGVNPKDINVSMENGTLAIKGERKNETKSEDAGVRRIERQYGFFSRSFHLPENANGENIEADARNGELKITIPKQEAAVSRRIDVKH